MYPSFKEIIASLKTILKRGDFKEEEGKTGARGNSSKGTGATGTVKKGDFTSKRGSFKKGLRG